MKFFKATDEDGFRRYYYDNRLTYKEKVRRKKIFKTIFVILGAIILIVAGYFVMRLMLDISYLPPDISTTV
ncbi:MAG: hypothetical protein K6F09_00935 [Clostridiales bacterium]|nr:hypothetical protein [Clostridiales bacterium]